MIASEKDRDTHEEISVVAYGIWESEGRPVGRDQEHWAVAAEIVTGRPVSADESQGESDVTAGEAEDHTHVRPAGQDEMDMAPPTWSETDEESDESFPASDPPGNY